MTVAKWKSNIVSLAACSAFLLSSLAGGAAEASIRQGDSGSQVTQLQQKLRESGYAINIDGSFGSSTVRLVKDFQKKHGLEADGIVGEATQVALFGRVIETPPAPVVKTAPITSAGGNVARLLEIANSLQGTPYVWGGSSAGGFDCSGFVQYVFAAAGVSLPRTCDVQFEVGQPVEKSQLQPGDVVFFETYTAGPSHVGIYLSDGMFIHASSAEGYVCLDNLNREYRIQTYIGARRMM
ncbi:MAG: C40 family peptidase [Selenomonadaceae bacterium]|nr:C40 family peptidase [Selenomonadaceae bacterium]